MLDIEQLETTIKGQMGELERLQDKLNEAVQQNEGADVAVKD